MSSDGAGDVHHFASDDSDFVHGSDEGQSEDVETGRVLGSAHLGRRDALVQAAVVGLNGRDVQVGHHLVRTGHELVDLDSATINSFAYNFTGKSD